MLKGITFEIDDGFEQLAKLMRKELRKSVANAINNAIPIAQELAVVDTGAMSESVYGAHPDSDRSYDEAVSSARIAAFTNLDMHQEVYSNDPLNGAITAAVMYHDVVELGAGQGRNSVPRPFIAPAVEAVQDEFESDVQIAVEKAIKKSHGSKKRVKRSG